MPPAKPRNLAEYLARLPDDKRAALEKLRSRMLVAAPGAEDCISGLPTTPAVQYWHVRGREIEAALLDLPQAYREAVVLVLVTGESYLMAAQILGCDVGTIKSRINRGRRLLQTALGEEV